MILVFLTAVIFDRGGEMADQVLYRIAEVASILVLTVLCSNYG